MPFHHILLVIGCGVVLLATIGRSVFQGQMRIGHAVMWLVLAAGFFVSPLLFTVFAKAHVVWNWPTPTSMLFLLGFVLLLILLVQISEAMSRSWRERKYLVQRQALLECRLAELERKAHHG